MTKRRSNTKSAEHMNTFNNFLADNPIPIKYEQIQKKFSPMDMKNIQPMTENQDLLFRLWNQDHNLFLSGIFGSGKSFLSMYLALNEILDPSTKYKKLIIIRSAVTSREIGHLKGTAEEKLAPYVIPYMNICDELFRKKNQYKHMEEAGIIEFHCSSFVRGNTFNDSIILIDEVQNFNRQEAVSCISRAGQNTKVILMGDGKYQNDLQYKKTDQSGFNDIYKITSMMPSFRHITFVADDIVRSGLCKELALALDRFDSK